MKLAEFLDIQKTTCLSLVKIASSFLTACLPCALKARDSTVKARVLYLLASWYLIVIGSHIVTNLRIYALLHCYWIVVFIC